MFFKWWHYDLQEYKHGGRTCGHEYRNNHKIAEVWYCPSCTGTKQAPASEEVVRHELIKRRYEDPVSEAKGSAVSLSTDFPTKRQTKWTIGSEVQVYSVVTQKWHRGVVSKFVQEGNEVEVVYDVGGELRIKTIPRDDTGIRDIHDRKRGQPTPTQIRGSVRREQSVSVGVTDVMKLSSAALGWAWDKLNKHDFAF